MTLSNSHPEINNIINSPIAFISNTVDVRIEDGVWLNEEVNRLSLMFDEKGVMYDEDAPTIPQINGID